MIDCSLTIPFCIVCRARLDKCQYSELVADGENITLCKPDFESGTRLKMGQKAPFKDVCKAYDTLPIQPQEKVDNGKL